MNHQFLTKTAWDQFYNSLGGPPGNQSHTKGNARATCANCGEWAGDHRAATPPLCPPYHGENDSEHPSFSTAPWTYELVGQPLSQLIDELLHVQTEEGGDRHDNQEDDS